MDTLSITGEVFRACEFGLLDLKRMAGQVDDVSAIIPGREGGAIEFAALIQMAGVKPGATHAALASADGFRAAVPLVNVQKALVVYRLGNAPLPADKGGPFRFLIPNPAECHSGGADKCANIKGLSSIVLTRDPG
ncbi:MAG: molybdopterin-dependent oxidoreductase [Planctomycetes bacterium]|nr:molybdopterin-dependent oxidoreductase [Planctomycetota bacterium]NUQ33332.1 molybdopterin-dependent oxidoreductase [Planctomycetaceae bacterium]